MMLKARPVMQNGVATVEKGMAQYVQICTGKGCLPDVNAGNEVINKGLQQAKQGMALLDQGQKEFQVCKANRNLEGAISLPGYLRRRRPDGARWSEKH